MVETHKIGRDGLREDGSRTRAISQEDRDGYALAKSMLETLKVPRMFDASNPHARLFIANFDGTGNDALKDRHHITNVGTLHEQLRILSRSDRRIRAHYVPGPGTQKEAIESAWDGMTGRSYDARLEEMYRRFAISVGEWKKEDLQADVRLFTTGFSRGAEQAAGFARLVHERGIPGHIRPGRLPITEVLYDPVGTGVPYLNHRTPPPSVVSGLQIVARDERRDKFPSSQIIPQGLSADGRFLGLTVAGAHSDVGGSYHLDGLPVLNFNLVADFINAHSDMPLVAKQPEPVDPRRYAIHHSEDHAWYFGTAEWEGNRREHGSQVSAPHCRPVQVCAPPEPLDPALAPFVEQRYPVTIGPLPPPDLTPAKEPGLAPREAAPDRTPEASRSPTFTPSPRGHWMEPEPSLPARPPLAAIDRHDPSHLGPEKHALYDALQARIPDASPDRLFQFTAACHAHRITAGNLDTIHLDEERMAICFQGKGWLSTPAVIDLTAPLPQPEQSIQQIQQIDQRQMQIDQEIAQAAQLSQQQGMTR